MSRIDEALRRASQGSGPGRATARSEAPLRRAEEFTINEYPGEGRVSAARVDGTEFRPEPSSPPPFAPVEHREPEVRQPSAMPFVAGNEKLVVARKNDISTEQYRRLAATLHEAQAEKGLKTVMVTSAVPREGKTLTTVNLAYTLSESYGRRVLLIDADLRRPSIHDVLGLRNDRGGLSDVLRSDRLEAPTIQVTPRLSVLLSGRPDQNPLAGLSSERMRALLADAGSRFDWVLLDTPPVGLLTDAQVLGRIAQAAIFVIRAGSTPFAAVQRAIDDLGRDCVIGTVLNGVDEGSLPESSYDYSGYGEA